MIVETCPLLNDIPWIKHGFFGADNPCKDAKTLFNVQNFNDDFPKTLFLKQVHSDHFITQTDESEHPADASITLQENLALAIKTADCCPVLLVCTHSRQIAAIHAGWPGALNEIVPKTLRGMLDNGAKVESMIAAIGPSVAAETYPVQDDVRNRFPEHTMPFFAPFEDRWKLDVTGIVLQQLAHAGVLKVWKSTINTFNDTTYFSYRRFTNGLTADYGSNISVIMKINP